MIYGIIFWGNSTHSSKIIKIQKRAITILMGRRSREILVGIYLKN
jgi:hypothetical protein